MSRGVGWQSALWARPLYRGPVAKRVAVSAGGASLRSVKKTLSEVESLTSLCPLFPSLHVLRFFLFFCFFHFAECSSLLGAAFAGPRCSTGRNCSTGNRFERRTEKANGEDERRGKKQKRKIAKPNKPIIGRQLQRVLGDSFRGGVRPCP